MRALIIVGDAFHDAPRTAKKPHGQMQND